MRTGRCGCGARASGAACASCSSTHSRSPSSAPPSARSEHPPPGISRPIAPGVMPCVAHCRAERGGCNCGWFSCPPAAQPLPHIGLSLLHACSRLSMDTSTEESAARLGSSRTYTVSSAVGVGRRQTPTCFGRAACKVCLQKQRSWWPQGVWARQVHCNGLRGWRAAALEQQGCVRGSDRPGGCHLF